MDWDDLKVLLAVARQGTLGAAARAVGQTQPTMGRRLRALEQAVGHALFQRTAEGFVLTDEGIAVLAHAERMEEEALALARKLTGQQPALGGLLRVSSSDWFGARVLTPIFAEFARMHPDVVIELLTDARPLSLARREADLAFRITPFTEPDVIARRLLHVEYGLYAAHGMDPPGPEGAGARLVIMDRAFGGMPDVAWLERMLPQAIVAFRSNSRDVQARACADGLGLAVLPRPLGDVEPALQRIDLSEPPPGRDTWVGYHRDLLRLPRLRALMDLVVDRLAG